MSTTPTEPVDEPDADVTDLPPADGKPERSESDDWAPLPIPESEDDDGDQ